MSNYFKEWYKTHRKFEIRDYADRILSHELPEAFKKDNVAVLAAAPNSGKTIMAIAWLEKYLEDNPTHRVLILAHNQRQLRDQFCDEIDESNVNFTYEKADSSESFLDSMKQVVVTIPRTIIGSLDNINNQHHFDLLIVDEAHHYYVAEEGMVSRIINKYNFDKQLLLTGTPSQFIAQKMNIIPVSLEELVHGGYCSDPIVTIVKTTSKITEKDINKDEELKKSIIIDKNETFTALDNLLPIIEERISVNGWRNSIDKLSRTLIVCRRIDQSNDVADYFEALGIETLLSTSSYDPISENIKKFTTNDENKILIVVDRAILGFNFPELISIIDMKYGKNINNLFQLFNRITRLHPVSETQKYYFKVVPNLLQEKYTYMLAAAISLLLEENYLKYNGYTSCDLKVRVRSCHKNIKSSSRNKLSTTFRNQPIDYLDIVPIFEMWKSENSLYSWSTLKKAYTTITSGKTSRRWNKYCTEENFQYCFNMVQEFISTKTAA